MIKEFEFYHGIVFSKLIHNCNQGISIKPYETNSNASYVLNNNIGIYIKHTTKRLTPWRFSFQKPHQDEILEMKKKFGHVFLILVCGEDGVVTLSFEELKTILDDTHGDVEWISAARNPNEEYTVNGSDGKLGRKVGKSDFPKKILKVALKNIETSPLKKENYQENKKSTFNFRSLALLFNNWTSGYKN